MVEVAEEAVGGEAAAAVLTWISQARTRAETVINMKSAKCTSTRNRTGNERRKGIPALQKVTRTGCERDQDRDRLKELDQDRTRDQLRDRDRDRINVK